MPPSGPSRPAKDSSMGDGASRHEQQVAPSNSRTDSQTKYQDVDQKSGPSGQTYSQPPHPRQTESPYPYYTPREGEVVWPPGLNDLNQSSHMAAGPSRLPYDPGPFNYGPDDPNLSPSQYPYPIPLDRAFDNDNYAGMASSRSTDPSMNIMTPSYPFPNTEESQQQRGRHDYSNPGSYDQQLSRPSKHSLSSASYSYQPSDSQAPQRSSHEESRDSRQHSKRLDVGSGQWQGQGYGQMAMDSGSGSGYGSYMPPIDPGFYPPRFSEDQTAQTSPQHPAESSTRQHRAKSTSAHSASSPQGVTSGADRGRRMSSEAGEDEEDWNHLPESERAMAKLNKRRGQNKLAQRAFRARTRVQNAKTNSEMAHLTELTQSQAKRLDDMTILVAELQKENMELRMAALNRKSALPPLPQVQVPTSLSPLASTSSLPPGQLPAPLVPPPGASVGTSHVPTDLSGPSPVKSGRTPRRRKLSQSQAKPGPTDDE